MSMGGHQSQKALKEEWLTPPWLLRLLGPFDLDPCAPAIRPWPMAAEHFTIFDNGLVKPWRGFVWLNPPYGDKSDRWLARLADHNNGLALVFARTETSSFHQQIWQKADALLFLQGRLHFHHANGTKARANAGAPSVLVAYGAPAALRLQAVAHLGQLVRLENPDLNTPPEDTPHEQDRPTG